MNLLRSSAFFFIAVAVTAAGAYLLGKEFIRADHYDTYWVIMIVCLVALAAIVQRKGVSLRGKSGWAIGLGLGLGIGFLVMLFLLALGSEDFVAQMPADAEYVGVLSLITFWATLSIVHFGWIPYIVLFGLRSVMKKD